MKLLSTKRITLLLSVVALFVLNSSTIPTEEKVWVAPTVSSVTPSVPVVTDGTASFFLDIVFDQDMNTAVNATISFPTGGEDPTVNTLTQGVVGWQNATTFRANYTVADGNENIPAIDVRVTGAENDAPDFETMATHDEADVFSVDNENPTFSITPSVATINDGNVGAFSLTIDFSEPMDDGGSNDPGITFPTGGENPLTNTLTTAGGSGWLDSDTWVENYTSVDANETILLIDVDVAGTQDANGNAQGASLSADEFSIDTQSPSVTGVSTNLSLITDANIGAGNFDIVVDFDQAMNTGVTPTIAFPVENPTGTITSPSGAWSVGDTRYTATYDIGDNQDNISNIDIRVTAAQDPGGNTIPQSDNADEFSIEMDNPTVLSITPAPLNITDSEAGGNNFMITVVFSEAMDDDGTPDPTISFPVENPTGTIGASPATDSWPNNTTYQAVYFVTDINAALPDVDISVDGAQDAVGNPMVAGSSTDAFDISMDNPVVSSVTPNINPINQTDNGSTFELDVLYDRVMNTGVDPTVSFPVENPAATLGAGSGAWQGDNMTFRVSYTITDADQDLADIDVRVDGGQDSGGNPQSQQDFADNFDINMAPPTIISVTPSDAIISDPDIPGTLVITVVYSEPMNTGVDPTLAFPVEDPTTTTGASPTGTNWANSTTFEATYTLAASDETVTDVDVQVTGGQDIGGSTQALSTTINVFSVDTDPPSGYTVTIQEPIYNVLNETSVDFQLDGGEIGATYNYTYTDGGTNIMGSGTVSTDPQTIGGEDINTLNDGTINLNVTLTDVNGNVGSVANDSETKDTAPPVFTVGPNVINVVQKVSFTFDFSSDEDATLYYVIIDNHTPAGAEHVTGVTPLEIKTAALTPAITTLGTLIGGGSNTISSRGTFSFSAGPVTQLFSQTALNSYDIYYVLEGNATTGSGALQAAYTYNGDTQAANPLVTNVTASNLDGDYGIDDIIQVQVTFNATVFVSGGIPSIELETGTTDREAVYVSGSGTNVLQFNYTVIENDVATDLQYTTEADGILLNGSTIDDGALDINRDLPTIGAAGSLNFNKEINIDGVRPAGYTVTILEPFANIATTGSMSFRIDGGEIGTNYDYTFSDGGGTVVGSGAVTTDPQTISGIDLSSLADGNIDLTVFLTDAVGNQGADAMDNVTKDTDPPDATVTVSTDPINVVNNTQTVTITYNEPMDAGNNPSASIAFATSGDFTSNSDGLWSGGNTWTESFDHGVVVETILTESVSIPSTSGATDVAGNPDIGDTSPTFAVDTDIPNITNVASTDADGIYGPGQVITIEVDFDEIVNVPGTPVLNLNSGGTATYASGAGTSTLTFTYTIGAIGSGENADPLDVTSITPVASIVDQRSNDTDYAIPGGSNVANNNTIEIDTERPTVLSVSSSTGTGFYNDPDVISIEIEFDEIVNVTGTPELALNSGGAATAFYSSGSGSTTLVFLYIVTDGENSADLDYDDANSLTLAGGTIQDEVSIDATLTLPTPGAVNSISDDEDIVVDTIHPDVLAQPAGIIIGPSPTTNAWSITNGTSVSSVEYTVVFSEDVLNVATTDFVATGGNFGGNGSYPLVSGGVTGVSGSGDTYTITVSGINDTGWLKLDFINAGTVTDLAGNPTTVNLISSFINSEYYTIVLPEPTSDVTGQSVTGTSTTTLTVGWTETGALPDPSNYLVVLKGPTGTWPTIEDGSPNGIPFLTDDTDLVADDVLWNNVTVGSTSTVFSGLNSGTAYDFRIYPYTLSPNNTNDNVDFKADSPASGSGTTNTGDKSSIASGAGAEPLLFSSLITSDPTPDAVAPQLDAILNFDFTVTDDGLNTAIDNSPTKIATLRITKGSNNEITDWTEALAGAQLTDGVTPITGSIDADGIDFTLPATSSGDFGFLDDNASKTYELRVWLNITLGGTLPVDIDGKFIEFRIHEDDITYNNTGQASSTFEDLQTEESGDANNQFAVVAAQPLRFITDPFIANPLVGWDELYTIRVEAWDQNNNRDLDFDFTEPGISLLTNEATVNVPPAEETFVDGVFETSNFSFTTEGDGQLTVQAGGLNVTSAQVDVVHLEVSEANDPLTNGVEPLSTLGAGFVDRAIFGFALTPFTNFSNEPIVTDITINFGNNDGGPYVNIDIEDIFRNLRLFESNDQDFDIGADLNITPGSVVNNGTQGFDPGTGTFDLTFSGVNLDMQVKGQKYYFIVADVDFLADIKSPAIQVQLQVPDVVTSNGSVYDPARGTSSFIGRRYAFADPAPPQLSSRFPLDGSINVNVNSNIVLTFNEPVIPLDSVLFLATDIDTTLVATLAGSADSTVFTYTLPGMMASETEHFVRIAPVFNLPGFTLPNNYTFNEPDSGYIDASLNPFPGIAFGDWSFTTSDSNPPILGSNNVVNVYSEGFDVRVQIDELGEVFYLITESPPTTPPTVAEVINPAGYVGGTNFANGMITVIRPDEFHYAGVSELAAGNYTVWIAAQDFADPPNVTASVTSFNVLAGAMVDPAPDEVIIHPVQVDVSELDICIGEYQPLLAPINIVEEDNNDFGAGTGVTLNVALPTGFEFNTDSIPVITLTGGNISNGSSSFINNSTLQVSYDASGTNDKDKIAITGLWVKATGDPLTNGNITRIGGTAVQDGNAETDARILGALMIPEPDSVNFSTSTGSFTIGNNVPIVGLLPQSVPGSLITDFDDGTVEFSGPGVLGTNLFTAVAGIGDHDITFTYTDSRGCKVDSTKQITVFDNANAIIGLKPKLCTNEDLTGREIPFDGIPAFTLIDLQISRPTEFLAAQGPVNQLSLTLGGTGYLFTPSVADSGVVDFQAVYQENANAANKDTVVQRIEVFIPPPPDFLFDRAGNVIVDEYCENGTPLTLTGTILPSIGFSRSAYYINDDSLAIGLTNNDDGTALIDLQAVANDAGFGTAVLTYRFWVDSTTCSNDIVKLIDVNQKPTADFDFGSTFGAGAACDGTDVDFTDLSTIGLGSVTGWLYDFDDVESVDKTSTDQNPSHLFTTIGSFNVELTAISDVGCNSDPVTKTVPVGAIPDVQFDFSGVSTSDAIQFESQSTVAGASSIIGLSWDFGDGNTLLSPNNNEIVSNTYANDGLYTASVTINTDLGCSDMLDTTVVVVPNIVVTDGPAGNYFENFEGTGSGSDGGWVALPTTGSWARGTPTGNKQEISATPTLNSANVWVTNLDGSYLPEEKSYVYSPSFDISTLTRPMISFVSYTATEISDGVVLQYSIDSLNISDPAKVWTALGSDLSGIGWYNASNLASKPGEQATGDYGWTVSTVGDWEESKETLSDVDSEPQVVFRFALGSNNPGPTKDGFAFDNVRIGNRTRTVLVESFSNFGVDSNVAADEASTLASLSGNAEGVELIRIQYRTSFPDNDTVNVDNPLDVASRGLFYEISEVPRARVDGLEDQAFANQVFNAWGQNFFDQRVLQLSKFSIAVTPSITASNELQINASLTALEDILDGNTVIHTVVVEKDIDVQNDLNIAPSSVTSQESTLEFVMKQMLPSASGEKFGDPILKDDVLSISNTYAPLNAYDLADLAVVVFAQNENTKEVYQSALVDLPQVTGVITGIADDLTKDGVAVYPNPALDYFTIQLREQLSSETMIRVFDQFGRLIEQTIIPAGQLQHTIRTTGFSNGIHFIHINSGSGVVTRKLMIMN